MHYTDDSEYPSSQPDRVSDASRDVVMADVLVRLRIDLGSRIWLATGYRAEAWNAGELPEFSASGLTLNAGFCLGGS